MRKHLRLGFLALLMCAPATWAVDWKALRPQGYVSDFAGVVDAASKARLESYCASVERATKVQMALVTIPSLEGEPIEDVANTIARAWGVGQKGENEGILLLLSIQDRRSRLEIGYGLEPILPDGLVGSILREMRPALREQNYGEAMLAAADTLGRQIAQAKNVALDQNLPRRVRPTARDSFPLPLIIGGIFLLALLAFGGRHGGGRRGGRGGGGGGILPALILGHLLGRSSGGHGGGGFGGYDSGGGGGFGGFGGGDFGGGGASSDW